MDDKIKTAIQNRDGTPPISLHAEIAGISLEYTLECARRGNRRLYTLAVLAVMPDGGTDRAVLAELTADRALALSILRALRDGAVTPCAASGIADDMLAGAAIDRALSRLARPRRK